MRVQLKSKSLGRGVAQVVKCLLLGISREGDYRVGTLACPTAEGQDHGKQTADVTCMKVYGGGVKKIREGKRKEMTQTEKRCLLRERTEREREMGGVLFLKGQGGTPAKCAEGGALLSWVLRGRARPA